MDGTVREIAGSYELRFERELSHPMDKVWAALTDPMVYGKWLAEKGEIELRIGGRVSMPEHGIESTVTAIDPPKLIEYGWKGPDWDGGTVRWELDTSDGGTRLVLTHRMRKLSEDEERDFRKRFPELPEGWEQLSSTLAGWHSLLELLPPALDGTPEPFSMDRWKELDEHYKQVAAR